MKHCRAIQYRIRIQPRTPAHHIRHGLFSPPIAVVVNIARCLVRPRHAVVLEQPRLRRQARVLPAAPVAVAEEPQQDVHRVADVLESHLLQQPLRAALADRVA